MMMPSFLCYKNSGSQSVLPEKAHVGLHVFTDKKYFLFFAPHNGQEQRFLLLFAVEMTKISFMEPVGIPK